MKVLLFTVLAGQAVLNWQFYIADKDLQDFRHAVVYDVRALQDRYESDLSEFYMTGCKDGIERPEQPKVVGFDANSPTNYCSSKLKERSEYLKFLVDNVGR